MLKDFKERDTNLSVKEPLECKISFNFNINNIVYKFLGPVLDPFIKFENKLEQLIPTTERVFKFFK